MKYALILIVFLSVSTFADEGCETGMLAFSKTLYPILTQRCTKCHGDMGSETPHSASDLKTAYASANQLVNFIKVSDSRFMVKVQQKHWLNYDANQMGMTPDEMLLALEMWKDRGGDSCPSSFKFISSAVMVPKILPDRASGQFVSFSFDLSFVNPQLLGCKMSFKIQRFTSPFGEVPGSFRVKDPTVLCFKTIHVSRIRLLVNHESQAYENIFESIDAVIAGSSSAAESLSAESMILIERAGDNRFELVIGDLNII